MIKYVYVLMLLGFIICGFSAFQTGKPLKGKDLYRNCSGCHLANGMGVKGFYPPHVKHVPFMVKTNEGRKYLIDVVLFGLQGNICVENVVYNKGVAMPPWDKVLNDDQIASVLNYVTMDLSINKSFLPKDFKPFKAKEIKEQRDRKLSDKQVYQERIKTFGTPCIQ